MFHSETIFISDERMFLILEIAAVSLFDET